MGLTAREGLYVYSAYASSIGRRRCCCYVAEMSRYDSDYDETTDGRYEQRPYGPYLPGYGPYLPRRGRSGCDAPSVGVKPAALLALAVDLILSRCCSDLG